MLTFTGNSRIFLSSIYKHTMLAAKQRLPKAYEFDIMNTMRSAHTKQRGEEKILLSRPCFFASLIQGRFFLASSAQIKMMICDLRVVILG